jgi:hypothetical protein
MNGRKDKHQQDLILKADAGYEETEGREDIPNK